MHGRAREWCATITTKLAILMGQLAMINRVFWDVHKAIWVIQTRGTDGGKPGKITEFFRHICENHSFTWSCQWAAER